LRNNSRESSIETKRTCSKAETAEFFAKNKNIIGFDNTLDKYLYTTVEY
jgi:DNA topoisomerase VI subunit B